MQVTDYFSSKRYTSGKLGFFSTGVRYINWVGLVKRSAQTNIKKLQIRYMSYWPSVRSRWLDIGQVLFSACLWTETKSRSINTHAFCAGLYIKEEETQRHFTLSAVWSLLVSSSPPFICEKTNKPQNTGINNIENSAKDIPMKSPVVGLL